MGRLTTIKTLAFWQKKWSPMVCLWLSKEEVSGLARKVPSQRAEKVKSTLPWYEPHSISCPEKEPTGFT